LNHLALAKFSFADIHLTGGKSTLALSFFRFVEATSGKIIIDGVNIADIGLTDLRSRLSIIPRGPLYIEKTWGLH
jgi:ABC-type multidrug transport system fused ATPase/permease subunit